MSVARVLSWFELAIGVLLGAFSLWLLLDLRTASPEIDRHGYRAMGAIAGLLLALASGLGGGLLRLSSKWRWLGQAPLIGLLIAMYVFN